MLTRNVLALTVATLLSPVLADAHPHLNAAGPAPGSVVKTAPKAVRIQFSEGVVEAFSGAEILNAKGEVQKTRPATLLASDKTQLVIPLAVDLAPGKYTVAWHAVGDDTHRVKGTFSFEVKP